MSVKHQKLKEEYARLMDMPNEEFKKLFGVFSGQFETAWSAEDDVNEQKKLYKMYKAAYARYVE